MPVKLLSKDRTRRAELKLRWESFRPDVRDDSLNFMGPRGFYGVAFRGGTQWSGLLGTSWLLPGVTWSVLPP